MRRTSSKPTEDKKPAPVRKRAEDSEISVPRKQLKTVATSAQASPQLSISPSTVPRSSQASFPTTVSRFEDSSQSTTFSSPVSSFASQHMQSPSSNPYDTPKSTPPIRSLQDFGMEVDDTITHTGGGTVDSEHSLKCCVICCEGKVVYVVFRCQVKIGYHICWQEKLFNDSVRENHPWATALGLTYSFPWAIDGVPQVNSRNYAVRLFCASVKPVVFNAHKITEMAQMICEHLNALNNNRSPTIQVSRNLFWLPTDGSILLSDITTSKEVLTMIQRKCGNMQADPNFYSTHSHYIHSCCFRRNQLTAEIADMLGAPTNQIKQDNADTTIQVDSD